MSIQYFEEFDAVKVIRRYRYIEANRGAVSMGQENITFLPTMARKGANAPSITGVVELIPVVFVNRWYHAHS